MLEFCGRKFICDECHICEGIEHKLNAASVGGYKPQLEYCGCDKVQTEVFIGGYCSESLGERIDVRHGNGKRKS